MTTAQLPIRRSDFAVTAEMRGGPLARQRICILSDDLSGAPDEGVKKYTLAVAEALRAAHDVAVLSTRGPVVPPGVAIVAAPRTFLSRRLRAALRRQNPAMLVYAARGSATFFGFLRSRLLKRYCPEARVVLLGLQTRRHSRAQRWLIRHLQPDLVAVQSAANASYLLGLGCRVAILPSGVDLATFRPVAPEQRRALRLANGLDPDRPVILHIGHLEAGRGIGVLADLARAGDAQVVLVTSSSTTQHADEALRRELLQSGVRIVATYVPHIEEFHQLADCYVFPVQSTDNAIELPLTVLEALACDLPVVTTRYGGLPQLFGGASEGTASGLHHPGLVFIDRPDELVAAARQLCTTRIGDTRHLVQHVGWARVAEELLVAAQ